MAKTTAGRRPRPRPKQCQELRYQSYASILYFKSTPRLAQDEPIFNDYSTLTFSFPSSSFVDRIQKDQERLSVTAAVLNAIFDAFDISPRFAGFISRQHMPGSDTRFDPPTYKPRQHGR